MIRRAVEGIGFLAAAVILFTLGANSWVILATKDRVYMDEQKVSEKDVALVLGTSKNLIGGEENPFFANRIESAAKLFHARKIKHVILSGDNNTRYYNEPLDMRVALLAKGVPGQKITLDYAGFRTLDSIIRCKEIFGQQKITIVTQKFHSYRALYISDYYGLDAEVFAAENIPFLQSVRVQFRELLARPKAVLDLYLLQKDPKFLGEKEELIIP